MSRTFRDQFHRITKRLTREWLRRMNSGVHDRSDVEDELRRLNRKSGGARKPWYLRKLRQRSIDKKYEDISDE